MSRLPFFILSFKIIVPFPNHRFEELGSSTTQFYSASAAGRQSLHPPSGGGVGCLYSYTCSTCSSLPMPLYLFYLSGLVYLFYFTCSTCPVYLSVLPICSTCPVLSTCSTYLFYLSGLPVAAGPA